MYLQAKKAGKNVPTKMIDPDKKTRTEPFSFTEGKDHLFTCCFKKFLN